MDNNLTVTLGGVERTLIMSKMPFLKRLGEIAPTFNFLDPTIPSWPQKTYTCVMYFVWAGLLCGNHKGLTQEEVEAWMEDMDLTELQKIQYQGWAALTGKTVEELKNPTAQAINKNGITAS